MYLTMLFPWLLITGSLLNDAALTTNNPKLAAVVRSVEGDFDRFLNSFLISAMRDMDLFEKTSDSARAFDQMLVAKSFGSVVGRLEDRATPFFHDFWTYNEKIGPKLFTDAWLTAALMERPACLARIDRATTKRLLFSILLSHGDVDIQSFSTSILIAGSDVRIMSAERSMIFAAGDVTLGNLSDGSLIVAGGKVTIAGRTQGLFIVTPQKLDLQRKITARGAKWIVYDAKPSPAPGLFRFQNLADYGVEAVWDEGRVKITKVNPDSVFRGHLKEGDYVASALKKRVDSIGQFRRLTSHFAHTHQMDLEIERSKKIVVLNSKLD